MLLMGKVVKPGACSLTMTPELSLEATSTGDFTNYSTQSRAGTYLGLASWTFSSWALILE